MFGLSKSSTVLAREREVIELGETASLDRTSRAELLAQNKTQAGELSALRKLHARKRRVAVMHIDPDALEAQIRGLAYPDAWVEMSQDSRGVTLIVYVPDDIPDAIAKQILTLFPEASRC